MHDPLAMRPVQCTGNLLCNGNRLFEGKWTPGQPFNNVFLVRTSDWTTRFSLPFSTHGLAWR